MSESLFSRKVLIDAEPYFSEALDRAFVKQKVKVRDPVKQYLLDILKHYLVADNLYDRDLETGQRKLGTLAELYLQAMSVDRRARMALLKKLGDRSLYISGFFAASLKKKTVDSEYYLKMGEMAFSSLSSLAEERSSEARLYKDMSVHFSTYMDSFSFVSENSFMFNPKDLFVLYEKLKADSELAKEKLAELGLPLIIPKAN